MSQIAPEAASILGPEGFIDRRNGERSGDAGLERRQFASSHEGLSPEGQELARAIDQYKVRHRRRFITYDEILDVVRLLGYQR